MNKEFVPYEEASALKELGFDEPCLGFYVPNLRSEGNILITAFDYEFDVSQYTTNTSLAEREIQPQFTAPIYQQVFKWFREKHNLYPFFDIIGMGYRVFNIKSMGHKEGNFIHTEYDSVQRDDLFDNEEEAEHNCLRKLIEIVKNK